MRIRPAAAGDIDDWVALRAALWPEADAAELRREAEALIAGMSTDPTLGAALLAIGDDDRPCGVIELSLRSYAEGCEGSPVPYVEGWFVQPALRGRGIGKALMAAAEAWALAQGFTELASDTLLDNLASQKAHAALGFAEVERAVHFRKVLKAG